MEEVPIRYRGRGYDDGKKVTWRDGVAAIGTILKYNLVQDRAHWYVAPLEDLKALAKEKDNPAAQKKAVKAVKSGEAANLRTALKAEPKSPTKTATNMAMDELTECLREHPDQDELRACLAFFKKSSPWVGKVLRRLAQ